MVAVAAASAKKNGLEGKDSVEEFKWFKRVKTELRNFQEESLVVKKIVIQLHSPLKLPAFALNCSSTIVNLLG